MTFITSVITRPTDDQSDAFGRLRVSNPHTQFDGSHIRGLRPELETQSITGLGTITLNTNNPTVDMTLTGTGTLIKQSRRRGVYQPSKSLVIYMTGVLNNNGANTANTTTRIGYNDDEDGIYFEHRGNGTNGTMYIVKRSKDTGAIVNTEVQQSSWNIDKMDGTGKSGIILDPSKTLIFVIDLEWLGVGRVRVGFIIGGVYYYAHQFLHSNIYTTVYINLASLPVRYSITSTSGGTGSLKKMCYAVVSEGGFDPTGITRTVSTGVSNKTVTATENSMMAIRIKSTTPKTQVRIVNIQGVSGSSKTITINMLRFYDRAHASILTNAVWVTQTDSDVEYDISATAIDRTGGHLLGVGYISVDGTLSFPDVSHLSTNMILSTNLQGLSDVVVITAQTLTQTDVITYGITYIEFL